MQLLLVKHSNSAHNAQQLPKDWPLTAEGVQRCKPLASHIALYKPHRLFTSTMPKAQQTAELVAQELGNIPIFSNPLLNEQSRQSNAPYGSPQAYKANIRKMFEHPDELIFGDESVTNAQTRFTNGVEAILKQAEPDENIVIIAHGTVNVLLVAQHNDIDMYQLWDRLALPSILVLDLPTFRLDLVIEDAGIPPNSQ